MTNTQKMFRAAGFLMLTQLLSRILGLLRDSLIAYHFGLSIETDAYNAAFILPNFLFEILAGGMISAALIPVLADYADDSQKKERWHIVSSVITITIAILAIAGLISVILAPYFIEFQISLNPEDTAGSLDKRELATSMTRLLMLQPLFMALSGIAMGVLNARKIFLPSSIGTLLYNASIIIVGGVIASFSHSIYAFVIGVLIGALLNFLVQTPSLGKLGYRYRLVADWRHPAVRRIAAMALPILVYQGLNQLLIIVYTNLGNKLPGGSYTAVSNAYRIHFMVVGIFAVAVVLASFPSLAELVARRQKREFIDTFSQAVRMVMFICIPASVGIALLRTPLISALYEHGTFSAADTDITAIPLIFFALGITAQGLTMTIPRAFYAHGDAWRPVIIGIIAVFLTIGLMVLFFWLFPQTYKTGALALAMSLGAIVQTLMLFFILRRKIGPLDGRKIFASTVLTTLASAAMAAFIYVWQYFMRLWLPPVQDVLLKKLLSIIELAGGIGIGFLIFIMIAKAFRMEEFHLMMNMVRRNKNASS